MDFQFNSDRRIDGTDELATEIEGRVRDRLRRFASRLTRIELHLRDIDGTTNGANGIECVIEARPANGLPMAASERSREIMPAVNGAIVKLMSKMDSTFGKADRVRP